MNLRIFLKSNWLWIASVITIALVGTYVHCAVRTQVAEYNYPPNVKEIPIYVSTEKGFPFKNEVLQGIVIANTQVGAVSGYRTLFRDAEEYQFGKPLLYFYAYTKNSTHEVEGACTPLLMHQSGSSTGLMMFPPFSINNVYSIRVCDNRIKQYQSGNFRKDAGAKRMRQFGLPVYFAHEMLHAMFSRHVMQDCGLMCQVISSRVFTATERQILKDKILPKILFEDISIVSKEEE